MTRSNAIGKAGENLAQSVLSQRNVLMAEKIGTPVRALPWRGIPGAFKVIWGEKVSGDHRGILKNGISVLAETKTVRGRNLVWSDLKPHQPERLQYHKDNNGISLLVWVSDAGVFVMEWEFPNDDFKPRKGMTIETAQTLDVMDVYSLWERRQE